MKKKETLEALLEQLAKSNLNRFDFERKCARISEIDYFDPTDKFAWKSKGVPIFFAPNGKVALKTSITPLKKQRFCVVDIECNGSKKNGGQVIEFGAVRLEGGVIKEKFSTLVYATEVPAEITELTGIAAKDLRLAPRLTEALERFLVFLGDDVFVAHNASFDYKFISETMEDECFGRLLNRRLCTINLSQRCIVSERYSLDVLKEILGIKNRHHRALDDAVAAAEILKHCLTKVPAEVDTAEKLIEFSKTAKMANTRAKEETKAMTEALFAAFCER